MRRHSASAGVDCVPAERSLSADHNFLTAPTYLVVRMAFRSTTSVGISSATASSYVHGLIGTILESTGFESAEGDALLELERMTVECESCSLAFSSSASSRLRSDGLAFVHFAGCSSRHQGRLPVLNGARRPGEQVQAESLRCSRCLRRGGLHGGRLALDRPAQARRRFLCVAVLTLISTGPSK